MMPIIFLAPTPRRLLRRCGAVLLLATCCIIGSACGEEVADPEEVEAEIALGEEAEQDETIDYQVYLSGAIQDTVQGNATFNTTWNPHSNTRKFLIHLMVGTGPGSGIYITQDDTARPTPGTYSLVKQSDTTEVQENAFAISYRDGLLRVLTSRDGQLVIESVSDTSISGHFDAELWGEVVKVNRGPGELPFPGPQQVNARGEFTAERGNIGYMIGID